MHLLCRLHPSLSPYRLHDPPYHILYGLPSPLHINYWLQHPLPVCTSLLNKRLNLYNFDSSLRSTVWFIKPDEVGKSAMHEACLNMSLPGNQWSSQSRSLRQRETVGGDTWAVRHRKQATQKESERDKCQRCTWLNAASWKTKLIKEQERHRGKWNGGTCSGWQHDTTGSSKKGFECSTYTKRTWCLA